MSRAAIPLRRAGPLPRESAHARMGGEPTRSDPPWSMNRMRKDASSITAPLLVEHRYKVGEVVDVLCDHNLDGERVRDWLQGIVVQADYKMVAVQFVEEVYLTDGWMVPDRILFCQQGAANIRPSTRRRTWRLRRARARRR